MKCPVCGDENRDTARFCGACAAPLARELTCPSCGSTNPPGRKFCDECGTGLAPSTPSVAAGFKPASGTVQSGAAEHAGLRPAATGSRSPRAYTPKHLADKILQSKSALEGERKQVTVLFADVKGSMELAEQLDPEQWHTILDRFFAILTEGVHRFEGTVNQYTGDGIMALFGAPIAHEDHAQRACYAALHLRDRLRQYGDELRVAPGVNFSFRLGLNSGEVIVGTIGDDLRMDYTAQGHTVGLAQRMEQLAPPDGIALSQYTQKPVDGFFALRSLGPVQVKGVREPVGVFVLEGVGRHRTRLDTSRARGLSRFVGRGDEIEALESALQRALAGTGRVAAVVGEPGVGKSRLCAEFVERCRARGLVAYEAHCPAHGRSIPYLPLLELLRNLFGIAEQDGAREARQKIAGELALLDDGFADDRALVLDFLGVADPKAPALQLEPAVRQRRLFTFLRRLIQLRTEAEPIVLLIDDLHWIDPGSDLFLAQIVEAVSATRTLLLVNFRPEYEADWTRKSWVLQLPMAPLGAEALAELVRDWVGSSPSVAALPALVGARSGGNPFFAEEIVLSLLETGRLVGTRGAYELATALDAVEVPATVQSLLAARIDRLGDREKQLLYTAAVIGKEFPRPLLESVIEITGDDLDAALAAVLAAELVYERAIYPVAEYAFKHPLTHEVALGAQLTAARRARHAAVAEAIAAAEADRLDEHAGLLAHHWTEAGEALRAATWHARAARWVRITDLVASRRHWAQARTLLVALPDSSERSRLLLEVYPELINTLDRLGAEPTESEAVFLEAIELARQAGDRRSEALVEAAYGWLKTGQNDWPAVIEHAERALTLADAEGDRPVQLFARLVLGRAFLWQGRLHESVRVFDKAAEIGGGDAGADIEVLGWRPYVECLSIRAAVHSFLGRPHEGLEFAERLPALLRRPGLRADMSSPAADRFWPCWILGDADRARRFSSEALQAAERFGADRNVVYALLACGGASCLALRWEEGDGFLERARERITTTGAGREWTMLIDGFQALCWAGMGDHERSLALARRGVEQTRANELDIPRILQGALLARVLRMVGGLQHQGEFEAQIAETLEVIQRTDSKGWLPFLLFERAGLARLRGDADGMARDLAEARRLFAQMGVTGWDDYARSIEA
jgi:class 3 adenylate cyclase/tetratricopeptide (TPR) repeat protein